MHCRTQQVGAEQGGGNGQDFATIDILCGRSFQVAKAMPSPGALSDRSWAGAHAAALTRSVRALRAREALLGAIG